VLRSACPPPAGCHFYFAHRVSFLSCADMIEMSGGARHNFLPPCYVVMKPGCFA
jgi:hypothetical protein